MMTNQTTVQPTILKAARLQKFASQKYIKRVVKIIYLIKLEQYNA